MWQPIVISSVYLSCLKLQTQLWLCFTTPGTDSKFTLMLSPPPLGAVVLCHKALYPVMVKRETLCAPRRSSKEQHSCRGLRGFLPMAQHQDCKPCSHTPINQQTCPASSPGQTLCSIAAALLPQLISPSLTDLSQGGTHIFSSPPCPSNLLSAQST